MDLAEEVSECFDGVCVLGIGGFVDGFGGLVCGEVEFASGDLSGFPVAPFGIASFWRADAVAHGFREVCGSAVVVGWTWVLGDGDGAARLVGVLQDSNETFAIEFRGTGELAELVEGGEEVDEFGDGGGGFSGGGDPGMMDEEWDAGIEFKG
ncbi:MAG: hypothetical protein RL215_2130 [Planctomycetota bacterium]